MAVQNMGDSKYYYPENVEGLYYNQAPSRMVYPLDMFVVDPSGRTWAILRDENDVEWLLGVNGEGKIETKRRYERLVIKTTGNVGIGGSRLPEDS